MSQLTDKKNSEYDCRHQFIVITKVDNIIPMIYSCWDNDQWSEGFTVLNLNQALATSGTHLFREGDTQTQLTKNHLRT